MQGTPGNKDFTPTADELKSIEKALKEPEFKSLFFDYLNEINNPENKKEYERQLLQVEREQGYDTTLITPIPHHTIKTTTDTNIKTFINITYTDSLHILPASSKHHNGGNAWSIPYSCSKERPDLDHAGAACKVFDIVFNKETVDLCDTDVRFKALLESTAIEGVEKACNLVLNKNYTCPKMKSKGQPPVTAFRRKDPSLVSNKNNSSLEFLEQLAKKSKDLETTESKPAPTNAKAPLVQEIADRPILKLPEKKKIETPNYKIVHQGLFDYSKCTNERDKQVGARPDALSITIQLPSVISGNEIDLDTSENNLELKTELNKNIQGYYLKLDLPFPCDHENGTAKFDKAKKELVVRLPVIPAPKVEIPTEERSDQLVKELTEKECEELTHQFETALSLIDVDTLPSILLTKSDFSFRHDGDKLYVLIEKSACVKGQVVVDSDDQSIVNIELIHPTAIYRQSLQIPEGISQLPTLNFEQENVVLTVNIAEVMWVMIKNDEGGWDKIEMNNEKGLLEILEKNNSWNLTFPDIRKVRHVPESTLGAISELEIEENVAIEKITTEEGSEGSCIIEDKAIEVTNDNYEKVNTEESVTAAKVEDKAIEVIADDGTVREEGEEKLNAIEEIKEVSALMEVEKLGEVATKAAAERIVFSNSKLFGIE